jgi:hypothetical protein
VKETVRDTWIQRAFPQFLGIPAPSGVERVTGHGDLHWGNVTGPPLTFLDRKRWGRVPVGYDPGLLHAYSLLVPAVAERIRADFQQVLTTPAGRIGELAALAELLQAVARGYYPDPWAPGHSSSRAGAHVHHPPPRLESRRMGGTVIARSAGAILAGGARLIHTR